MAIKSKGIRGIEYRMLLCTESKEIFGLPQFETRCAQNHGPQKKTSLTIISCIFSFSYLESFFPRHTRF
jgi:hypothetical protein